MEWVTDFLSVVYYNAGDTNIKKVHSVIQSFTGAHQRTKNLGDC